MKYFLLLSALFSVAAAHACGPQDPEDHYRTPDFLHVSRSSRGNIDSLLSMYVSRYPSQYRNSGYDYRLENQLNQEYWRRVSKFEKLRDVKIPRDTLPDNRWVDRHCKTNDGQAGLDFLDSLVTEFGDTNAVAQANLVEARQQIFKVCTDERDAVMPRIDELLNAAGADTSLRDHVSYLRAITFFYRSEFDDSERIFLALSSSSSPWIRDVSSYMSGRNKLAQGMTIGEWDYDDRTSRQRAQVQRKEMISAAAPLFIAYAESFPNGRYADSARNIVRLVYAFSGQGKKLDAELTKLVTDNIENNGGTATVEVDIRLLEVAKYYYGRDAVNYDNPLMLTAKLISSGADGINIENVNASAALYADYDGLLDFVRLHYYARSGDIDSVDSYLFEPTVFNAVTAGALAIKAENHERRENWFAAAKIWGQIGREVQSRYAQRRAIVNYIRADKSEVIFSGALGDLHDELIEEIVSTLIFDRDLERFLASDDLDPELRDRAGRALLRRKLLRENYEGFGKTLRTLENPGYFTQVQTAAHTLATSRHNPKGLLNVGYFLMKNTIMDATEDSWRPGYTKGINAYCNTKPATPVKSPYDYFLQTIALHDNGDKSVNEAKALHYIIGCFQTRYTRAACIWNRPVPQGTYTPREWFKRLHSKYPDSKWARKTKYFY